MKESWTHEHRYSAEEYAKWKLTCSLYREKLQLVRDLNESWYQMNPKLLFWLSILTPFHENISRIEMTMLEFYLYFHFIAFLNFLIWYINTIAREYTFFFSNLYISFVCNALRERKNGKFSIIGEFLDVKWYRHHPVYILSEIVQTLVFFYYKM